VELYVGSLLHNVQYCLILLNDSEGMDECDTAAMVYQCGQEKAPDFVANAITAVQYNKSAVNFVRYCFAS
jgi:hypothetical protein